MRRHTGIRDPQQAIRELTTLCEPMKNISSVVYYKVSNDRLTKDRCTAKY